MNNDEAAAAIGWIESIDISTADIVTCDKMLVVLSELREWYDEAIGELGELVVRSKPPLCSIHCHAPVRRMVA